MRSVAGTTTGSARSVKRSFLKSRQSGTRQLSGRNSTSIKPSKGCSGKAVFRRRCPVTWNQGLPLEGRKASLNFKEVKGK